MRAVFILAVATVFSENAFNKPGVKVEMLSCTHLSFLVLFLSNKQSCSGLSGSLHTVKVRSPMVEIKNAKESL